MSDDSRLMQKMRNFSNLKTMVNFINLECKKEMIDYYDQYGLTPLLYACKYNLLEIVKTLLKKGADINQEIKDNGVKGSAINSCIQYRVDDDDDLEIKVKMIDLLIRSGANIKNNTFNIACIMGEAQIIKKLLEYPINLEFIDGNGFKPTDYLTKNKNTEMLKIVEAQILKNKLEEKLSNKESTSNKMKI